jgi:multimeric flavodoxin WrbA
MKLLILNGIPNDAKYLEYEKEIEKSVLNNTAHEIDYFRLRDMDINFCQGCWDCWVKTPGKCAIKDDYEQVLSRMANADMVLYVTPVILGYESSILKTCKDRSIGIAHPYITIYKGEQHHIKRYEKTAEISVLLIKDDDTMQEDIDVIKATYFRNSLNSRKDDTSNFAVIDNTGGVKDVFDSI